MRKHWPPNIDKPQASVALVCGKCAVRGSDKHGTAEDGEEKRLKVVKKWSKTISSGSLFNRHDAGVQQLVR
jgi:hypothetical protein